MYFPVNLDEYLTPVLWVSDGTDEGTYQFHASDSSVISEPKGFINWNNQLYFLGHDYNSTGHQIYSTDGTLQNTYQVLNDSIIGMGEVTNEYLTLFNDELFFGANFIDTIGTELYKLSIVPSGGIQPTSTGNIYVKAYPNPFDDKFAIEFSDQRLIENIKVTDINGKIIYHNESKKETCVVDLSSCSIGVYFITINESKNTYFKKVFKI